jgi:hypothetical protein
MNTPAKLILGAVATGCIVVGVAAQVGTLRFPDAGGSPPARSAVEAQQATSSPSSTPDSSPSPSPQPTQQAAAPQPVVEAPPPKKKKHHGDG